MLTPKDRTIAAMQKHYGFPPTEGDWADPDEDGLPGLGKCIEEAIELAMQSAAFHSCEHEWEGHKIPGGTHGPDDYTETCKLCGMENPGSWTDFDDGVEADIQRVVPT